MRRRKITPAREQYEAAFPTVTARVPAEVKQKLDTVLASQGLNFSEWVQAHVAEAALGHEQAAAAGRAAGYREGLAEGRSQGRAAYLILAAAMLWRQYGERLGDTNGAWIDRRAVECVGALTDGQRQCLHGVLRRSPQLSQAVERWLGDSGLPDLGDLLAKPQPGVHRPA
jgi:hypothetical protein